MVVKFSVQRTITAMTNAMANVVTHCPSSARYGNSVRSLPVPLFSHPLGNPTYFKEKPLANYLAQMLIMYIRISKPGSHEELALQLFF